MHKDQIRRLVLDLPSHEHRKTFLHIMATDRVDARQQPMPRNSIDLVNETYDLEAYTAYKLLISESAPIPPAPVAIYRLLGVAFCVWADGDAAGLYHAWLDSRCKKKLYVEVTSSTLCQPHGVRVNAKARQALRQGVVWDGLDVSIVSALLRFREVAR